MKRAAGRNRENDGVREKHRSLIQKLCDRLDVALDALALKSLQRSFGVTMDAADLGDLQEIGAGDEECVDGLVGLLRADGANCERCLLALLWTRHDGVL